MTAPKRERESSDEDTDSKKRMHAKSNTHVKKRFLLVIDAQEPTEVTMYAVAEEDVAANLLKALEASGNYMHESLTEDNMESLADALTEHLENEIEECTPDEDEDEDEVEYVDEEVCASQLWGHVMDLIDQKYMIVEKNFREMFCRRPRFVLSLVAC